MLSVVPHQVASSSSACIMQDDMSSFAHCYTPPNTIHIVLSLYEVSPSENNSSPILVDTSHVREIVGNERSGLSSQV
jgi:hypothetical protein